MIYWVARLYLKYQLLLFLYCRAKEAEGSIMQLITGNKPDMLAFMSSNC